MSNTSASDRWSWAGAFAVFAAVCAASSTAVATPIAPDFALSDANPNSATNNQPVSPRDYLGQVSAWYFGHSI